MLVKSQPQSHHGLDAVAAKKFIAVLGVLTVVVPVLILPHMDDLCDVSDALCSGELAYLKQKAEMSAQLHTSQAAEDVVYMAICIHV